MGPGAAIDVFSFSWWVLSGFSTASQGAAIDVFSLRWWVLPGSDNDSLGARHRHLQHMVVGALGLRHHLLVGLPSTSSAYGGGRTWAPSPPPRGATINVICSNNISNFSGSCYRFYR
jgi:hypothetical protein